MIFFLPDSESGLLVLVPLNRLYGILVNRGGHRDLWYCGIELFSSDISVILILMCGIAVSSSPVVCGFHPYG